MLYFFETIEKFKEMSKGSYSKEEFEKIWKHFVPAKNQYKGNPTMRIINLTVDDVSNLIENEAKIYTIDSNEFDEKNTISFYQLKSVSDFHFRGQQVHKKRAQIMFDDIRKEEGTEKEFVEEFGKIDEKYLLDIYIIDINSAYRIIDRLISIYKTT